MENKHIALVKRWLADKTSVSSEELRANAEAAYAASAYATRADDYAAYAAASAAYPAAYAAADAADYWVKRYEEMTDE